MSGKRAKSFRKKNRKNSKKILTVFLGGALVTMPVSSEGDVLFSLYPHATIPLGSDNHGIEQGLGLGGKLAYKPIKYFSFNLFGDYLTLSLPKVESINVLDGGAGASYHVPLSDRFNLNAGVNVGAYRATHNQVMTGLTAGMNVGISYRLNPVVSIDMDARASHYAAGATALLNGISAQPGITINLSEAFGKNTNVKIDASKTELKPVFPVLYSWYENNPFGSITIVNEEDSKIQDIKVSFYQPQYMGHPNVCGVRDELEKGESLDVNLTAFFNEHMLELTEKADTMATISIEYTCLGQKRSCEYSMVVPVYGRNNMSWADDRRASVFVSSKDPAAMWFAKYVASITHDNMRNGVPENLQYAMAIFDTLDQFGLNYVIDPSSAFEDNVGTESIDFLQFPYQTLMYRGGDCDDISILVCSLFEAVGINTAFITIPGHIFMAFDSGLYKRQAEEQFGSLENFIVHGSEVWVPLEITLTDEGFNKAWRVGLREWRVAERDGTAAMYKMRDNWQIYKPVNVPDAAASFTLPDPEIVAKIFGHSVDQWILREIEPKIEGYKSLLAKKRSDKIQNALGTLYARYGLFVQAEEQFKPLRRKGYQPAILNTANMYFAKKDYERAEKWYKEVLKKDRKNVLAYLGVARCCYELENYDECDMAYLKVRSMDAGLAYEYSYLGAFENKGGRAFNLADRLAHTVWEDDSQDAWKSEYKKLVANNRAEMEDLYGTEIVEMVQTDRDVDVPDYMKFNPAEFALVPETGVKEVAENTEKKEGGDGNPDGDDDVFDLEPQEEYVGLPSQLEVEGPESVLFDIPQTEPSVALVKPAAPVAATSIEVKNETVEKKVSVEKVEKPSAEVKSVIPVKAITGAVSVATASLAKTASAATAVVAETVVATPAKTVVEPVETTSTPVETSSAVAETPALAVEPAAAEEVQLPVADSYIEETTATRVVEFVETVPAAIETSAPIETIPSTVAVVPVVVVETPSAEETPVVAVESVVTEEVQIPATDNYIEETSASVEATPAPAIEISIPDAEPAVPFAVVVEEPVLLVPDAEIAYEEELALETMPAPVVVEPVETTSTPVEIPTAVEETPAIVESPAVVETETIAAEEIPAVAVSDIDIEETTSELASTFEAEEDDDNDFFMEEINDGEFDLDEFLAEAAPLPVEENLFDEEVPQTESTESSVEEIAKEIPAFSVPMAEPAPAPAPAVALPEESILAAPIEKIAVPRFTKQPSEDWATEEAYVAEYIPGMLSFEEEMGQVENSKAYLYEEDKLNIDPDKDFEVVKKDKKEELTGPKVNPFSSYLSKEDAAVVEKITDFKLEPAPAVALAPSQSTETEKTKETEPSVSGEPTTAGTATEAVAETTVAEVTAAEPFAENAIETAAKTTAEVVTTTEVAIASDNAAQVPAAETVATTAAVEEKTKSAEVPKISSAARSSGSSDWNIPIPLIVAIIVAMGGAAGLAKKAADSKNKPAHEGAV